MQPANIPITSWLENSMECVKQNKSVMSHLRYGSLHRDPKFKKSVWKLFGKKNGFSCLSFSVWTQFYHHFSWKPLYWNINKEFGTIFFEVRTPRKRQIIILKVELAIKPCIWYLISATRIFHLWKIKFIMILNC